MEGVQYHINLDESNGAIFNILVGDPDRCEVVAKFLDNPQFVTRNREFTTYSGFICGQRVNVTSTGIGGPSAAIAIEELTKIGGKYFIRVGTCGGINMKVKAGDIVCPLSMVRQDGTSREYAPIEYPATASYEIIMAINKAINNIEIKDGRKVHFGVAQSKDSFYGQHSPKKSPVSYELLEKWESWKKLGVLASEMEAATLYTVASSLDVSCGSILSVLWNQERKAAGLIEDDCMDNELAIRLAVESVKMLINK